MLKFPRLKKTNQRVSRAITQLNNCKAIRLQDLAELHLPLKTCRFLPKQTQGWCWEPRRCRHCRKIYNSLEYFLGRLPWFLGTDGPHRHQKATGPGQSEWSVYLYALNSRRLDLLVRFPIPSDDMFLHSSFSWGWILCRNVPLLFVDVLFFCFLFFSFFFFFFKQASL